MRLGIWLTMAINSSGPIKLNADIGVELGVNNNKSTSLEDASTGTIATINTASSDRPDGSAPHSMSEFYGYNHSASSGPTAFNGVFFDDFYLTSASQATSSSRPSFAGEGSSVANQDASGSYAVNMSNFTDSKSNTFTKRPPYEVNDFVFNSSDGYYYAPDNNSTHPYIRIGPSQGFPASANFTGTWNVEMYCDNNAGNKDLLLHFETVSATSGGGSNNPFVSNNNYRIWMFMDSPRGSVRITRRLNGSNSHLTTVSATNAPRKVKASWTPTASSNQLKVFVNDTLTAQATDSNHNDLFGVRLWIPRFASNPDVRVWWWRGFFS